jgi:hypothetical protein
VIQDFRALQQRLDQMGLELLARANSLDALARQVDERTCQLDARERDLNMREDDVIMAWEQIKKEARQCQKTS